ncbi:efflux RND transporter periplasmic adaptor subunit [candidate division KSB1 bacterium]
MRHLSEKIDSKIILYTISGIVLIFVFTMTILFSLKDDPPGYELYTIQKQDLELKITESAKLHAVRYKDVGIGGGSGIMGPGPIRIVTTQNPQIIYLIPEGTIAQPGDTLAKLDPIELIDKRETYMEELNAEKQTYNDLLKSQELDERRDQRKIQGILETLAARRLELIVAEFESKNEQRKRKLQLDIALLDSIDTVTEIDGLRAERNLKKLQAQNKVDAAKKKVTDVEKEIDMFNIIAEYPALVVYATNYETGEKIKLGDNVRSYYPLFKLPDLSEMFAVLYVNDVDRDKIWNDQRGIMTLEAYPEYEFTGKVTDLSIMSQKSQDIIVPSSLYSNVKTFSVKFLLDNVHECMKPGMTAKIELLVECIRDAVTVPLSALFDRNGKLYVNVSNDSDLETREITIGKRNSVNAVIENGLVEGETIVLQRPDWESLDLDFKKEGYTEENENAELFKHFDNIKELGIDFDYNKFRESSKEETDKTKPQISEDKLKQIRPDIIKK